MNSINLLPWRETKLRKSKKEIIYAICFESIALVFLTIILIIILMTTKKLYLWKTEQLSRKNIAMEKLAAPIKDIENKIQFQSNIINQQKAFQQYNQSLFDLWSYCANIMPQGLSWQSLAIEKNTLTIRGEIQIENNLNSYLDVLRKINNIKIAEPEFSKEKFKVIIQW